MEDWKDGKLIDRKCDNPTGNSLYEANDLDSNIRFEKSPTTPLLSQSKLYTYIIYNIYNVLDSLESSRSTNKLLLTNDKLAEISKSPSINVNYSRSENIQSLAVSDNRTELNVGQETLSIIDYIDANFPILKKNVFEWDIGDVAEWLKHIGLDIYIETFTCNHIHGKNLFDINEEELKTEFFITSVGHRKNFLQAVDYLRKIYMENKGRRLSIIRNKLAQLCCKKHPMINWKTKKVKSVCDVIEEEDDALENNLISLPEEHEINEKYKALKKEGFLNTPLAIKTKRSSLRGDSFEALEEEKKEMPDNGRKSTNLLHVKNSKSNSTLEKSPLAKEESKNEILEDRINYIHLC